MFPGTKNVILFKIVLWWKEFKLDVCLPWKCLKKETLSWKDFAVQVDFGFWVGFLCFWRPWICLAKFLWCFLGILSNKWIENEFIYQNSKTLFSRSHSDRILGITNDMSSANVGDAYFFEFIGANNMFASLALKIPKQIFSSNIKEIKGDMQTVTVWFWWCYCLSFYVYVLW